jgi:1-acyl-sn-glycerol-3-phosphate acyltransferase
MLLALLRFFVGAWWTAFWSTACIVLWPIIGGRRAWIVVHRRWGHAVLGTLGIDWVIRDEERIKGPAVFVSNHLSFLDVVLLPAILPHEIVFIAKQSLKWVPLFGQAFAAGGAVLIDRSNARGAIESIRAGIRKLPPGWSIVIFPEGTRSVTGELKGFKKGVIHVALATKLPIVPLAIHGVRELTDNPTWKPRWLPRPGTIQVAVGEPVPTEHWTSERLDEHLAEVRAAVAAQLDRARATREPKSEKSAVTPRIMETPARPE